MIMIALNLDFTVPSLDPRITFARAGSTATAVDASGFVSVLNADAPRFDFDPVTLACRGLLIEESRQNRATYSSDLASSSGNPAAGIPLVPGAVEILRFTSEAYFSAKASENTTLYITPGTGL